MGLVGGVAFFHQVHQEPPDVIRDGSMFYDAR